jgi:hypothetical protein
MLKRSSTNEYRSDTMLELGFGVEITPLRVVEIVPAAVVEMVPVRVVEIVPTLVVEIVPVFVVEMVPGFAKADADNARTRIPAETIG